MGNVYFNYMNQEKYSKLVLCLSISLSILFIIASLPKKWQLLRQNTNSTTDLDPVVRETLLTIICWCWYIVGKVAFYVFADDFKLSNKLNWSSTSFTAKRKNFRNILVKCLDWRKKMIKIHNVQARNWRKYMLYIHIISY